MQKLNTAEIAKAILDGKDIEFKSADTGEWISVASKPIKPSIDWAQVNNELNYLAIDHDGGGTLFKDRPSTDGEGYWINLNNPVFVNAKWFSSFKEGTCDWKDSLVERPEGS